MPTQAPRYRPGHNIGYALVLKVLSAPVLRDVRYLVHTHCCDLEMIKSHKALKRAVDQHDLQCPRCARFDRPQIKHRPITRPVKPVVVVERTPVVFAAPIELTSTAPVELPEWLRLAFSGWPKPVSITPRVWGLQ